MKSGVEYLAQHPGWKTKRKVKAKGEAAPVVFVEGGIVRALLIPDSRQKGGYRSISYESVDYDLFDGADAEEIKESWEGFSDVLKTYFTKCLPDEKKKFMEAIEAATSKTAE
jgi:hypothetical protein